MDVQVVVEIGVDIAARAGLFADELCPGLQLGAGVIVPGAVFQAVKADINKVCGDGEILGGGIRRRGNNFWAGF